MEVVLFAATEGMGGADRAALRLLEALSDASVHASMVVRRSRGHRTDVSAVRPSLDRLIGPVRSRSDRLVSRAHRPRDDSFRSVNVWPTRLSSHLDADVVNLHWFGSGAMSVADVGRLTAPVVLTLHDMWAFAGASHYTSDGSSARWRATNDVAGPTFEALAARDMDAWVHRRKMRRWHRMHVVAPSRWLADLASASSLMAQWPVRVIPYPIDLELFRPVDRQAARRSLGLSPGSRVVAFGAFDAGTDRRKGIDLLRRALALVDSNETEAIVFGQDEPADAPAFSMPAQWLGRVDDDEQLARVYSAADVVVVPSRLDNLPQVAVEAQSCGVPVVAFRTGGLADCVEDGTTGLLAEPFDTAALAGHIRTLLADRQLADRMGRAGRRRAEALWEPSIVAKQYVDVYADAIESRGSEA